MWNKFTARQVIEALRCGVPTDDAVRHLGTEQPRIERAYADLLERVAGGRPGGLLVGGGFGTGKSHLLWHLGQRAQDAGFAVSRIVVSKETPLNDPVKVMHSALTNVTVHGQRGPALRAIVDRLDVRRPRFVNLLRWALQPSSGLDRRFAALLLLYSRAKDEGGELADMIVRFCSGDALPVADLRRRLRAIGEPMTIRPTSPRELAPQRARFAARLMAAAGHPGWVVLFDEAELIGRYALIARAKAYTTLAWWLDGAVGSGAPLGAVFAITDDFDAAVLEGKRDRDQLGNRIRARGRHDSVELAGSAEHGMALIRDRLMLLDPPADQMLRQVYQRTKELHRDAFEWSPPDVTGVSRSSANGMLRRHIRSWVNEWDLIRADPNYTPHTTVTPVPMDYTEA